jgi:spore coat protein CotF
MNLFTMDYAIDQYMVDEGYERPEERDTDYLYDLQKDMECERRCEND